ncbi:hypothetical protein CCYA_CCYA16G4079 [Cyanidiococcus yangmingshanensis]|uniref:fructose-bisphosphatase n=1 Tax=Cyanidiococcus yangmingshanensis TaxID=2690220 RepID=A0A7J7IER9_9RHOD|nr:hypothetical protein F1559_000788 [Cyanidiococcus yangmingshanensis]KAK4533197.1 hypothetical protein CCYA_CCYA16G4079 [Cyanidiococcus yangmingshanensis]
MGLGNTSILQYLMKLRHALHALENVECSATEDRRSLPVFDAWMDLVAVFSAVSVAAKRVGAMVRRAGLPPGSSRVAGEWSAMKMEQEANRIWIDELSASQRSCLLVSEDLPELLVLDEETQGKFVVVFDPLTGRANPPCTEMGAIFGIFRQLSYGGTKEHSPDWRDALQPARQLVCAGYVLYGPSVVLYSSFGAGVQGFTLDGAMNDWVLTQQQVRIPFCGHRYSLDEGFESLWDGELRDAVRRFKLSVCLNGERRSLRRTGSMVADLHRVMVDGGVVLYPTHADGPRGQLKVLYEAGPLAFLVEQAGGRAIDGKRSLLDVRPAALHDHVPAYMGSVDDIELLEQLLRKVDRDPMFQLRRSISIQEGMLKRNAASDEHHAESSWEPFEEGGGILASALPLLHEDDS